MTAVNLQTIPSHFPGQVPNPDTNQPGIEVGAGDPDLPGTVLLHGPGARPHPREYVQRARPPTRSGSGRRGVRPKSAPRPGLATPADARGAVGEAGGSRGGSEVSIIQGPARSGKIGRHPVAPGRCVP